MVSRLLWIDFGCADPYPLAGFWSAALGRPRHRDDAPGDDECEVGDLLLFQRTATGRRIHLDVVPTDRGRDEEVDRLLALGATFRGDHRGDGNGWVVLADPEGNEFCVNERRGPQPAPEPWGAALYGDPCRECGFDWSLTPEEAVRWVSDWGSRLAGVLTDARGDERSGGWSVTAYVSHVGDNLRQWSERLQSALLAGQPGVAGYDPDALAAARRYDSLPLAVAVWSSKLAAATWAEVVTEALAERIELRHRTRGPQQAADVARNNCHDAHHHLWDITRILTPG